MGYDLHITRKEFWHDEIQPESDITLQEWVDYIGQDNQLELSNDLQVKVPGNEVEKQVAPGFCYWTHHPENNKPTLCFSDGIISTKNPDENTIRKLIEIALKLNAHVQGDDGEIYELSGQGKIINRQIPIEDHTKSNYKKPWWKFW